jgi:hypothetical protein
MFVILWLCYSLIVVILLDLYIRTQSNSRRIAEIERKVDLLLQQFDSDCVDENLEPVESCLGRGDRLQALKVLLQLNPDTSLKEAVDVVTALEQEIQRQQVN